MIRSSVLVTLLAALGVLPVACSKDENPATRLSNLGEDCQSSADCTGSYVCRGSVCSVSTVGITSNNKVCQLVQCTKAEDCCPPVSSASTCLNYASQCEAGVTSYCTYYQQYCVCDASLNSCTNGLCVSNSTCTIDTECTTSARPHCSGGSCVACLENSHCLTSGYICSAEHTCVPSCTSNADCGAFYACTDSHCVYQGCTADRECKVDLGNAEAFCDTTSKTCSAKCANDSVCFHPNTPTVVSGSTTSYSYQLCLDGTCKNAGCDTDDECKALLETRITTMKSQYPHATAQCK
jgi:hypothetical protein